MESSTFPWLSKLTDEQAYEFLDEVVEAAEGAETRTAFLRPLDALVPRWAVTAEALAVVQQAMEEADPPQEPPP
ncbi:hypothetical protein [Streptomyces sp. NBC_01750]|uniref:hypothetical protein n=1 Tax=Streptomyces sp. NBC_01750 TaxID=2975928 RepID=UPI002DDBA0D2|nr:hypothetical protein [Streptomyces sp. NBC_01750]WSD36669.1 hypothetical protein OG966_35030 [Streptomyces sp. NBC_01750]